MEDEKIELKDEYKDNKALEAALKTLSNALINAETTKESSGDYWYAMAYGQLNGSIRGVINFFSKNIK